MKEKEFVGLIQKHSGIIFKIIILYTNNKEDKEDLYQEIIYQAWKSYANFRGESKFSTWLYRISINTSLTFIRKSQKEEQSIDHYSDWVSVPDSKHEKSDELIRAMKQLDETNRSILTLHFEGYKNDEIAEMCGISKNHVSVKLHRSKQQIVTVLKK